MSDGVDETVRQVEATLAEIRLRLDRLEAARDPRAIAIVAAEAVMRASADAIAAHRRGDDNESRHKALQHFIDVQSVAAAAGVVIAPDTRH